MKKATHIIAGALLGALFMAGSALAAVHGEIGVKGIGLDNTATQVNRFRDLSALPIDASLSLFNLDSNLFNKGNLIQFRGKNLGEDDVDAGLTLILGKWLTSDESYSKIRHNIAAASATERKRDSIDLRLLPLSKLNAFVKASTDFKIGKQDGTIIDTPFTLPVEQKTENGAIGVNATLWNLDFSGSGSKEKFTDVNGWSHEADGFDLALSLRPRSSFWGIASYSSKEYSANWNSAATNTVKLENAEVAAQYEVNNKLTIDGEAGNNKRSNTRSLTTLASARARDFDENVLSGALSYSNRCGSVSASYKTQDRDLSGTGVLITNRKTGTFKLKASTKVSFLNIRAGYTHGNRSIAGFAGPSNPSNWSFDNTSGEFSENNVSVTLLGFKYFNLVASNVAKHNTFNANETFGVVSNNSLNRGVTANYDMNDEVSFTLGAYNLRNRVYAKESYNNNAVTTSVNTGTNYLTLGSAFQLDHRTNLFASLTTVNSSVVDVLKNNSVKERTFSVGMDKQLSRTYSASAEISRNTYNNLVDTGYSPKNTLFSIELKKKF